MELRELAYHRFQCPACGTHGTVAYFADVTEIRCPRCQDVAMKVPHTTHDLKEEEEDGGQESRRTQPE